MSESLDLEAIKARCQAASSGQWEPKAYRVYAPADPIPDRIIAACWRPWGPVTGAGSIEADADFIAHARTDVPKLVAEIERLQIAVDWLYAEASYEVRQKFTRLVDGDMPMWNRPRG